MNSLASDHCRAGHLLARSTLLALSLALVAACGDQADSDGLGDISLRPAPSPIVELGISIAGDDVILDWSSDGEGSAVVYRSTSPSLRADLLAGQQGTWDVIPVGANATYTDVGAASHAQATPTYYYVVVLQSDAGNRTSPMGMKISTAMAPGYNKMAVCMEGGPSRASDVVARLGSSATGVWGWDPVAQSYISWTPAQGVGGDADFALPLGSVFAALVDGSTPAFQSLVGIVPETADDFTVSARPGYNWATLPVSYDGATAASYWVGQAGYWGIGRWNNLTQSQSWYWGAGDSDFDLEACRPHYTYLPPNACASNEDCNEDTFCYFVDAAACGDAAAGLCKARPIGCEEAPQGEVCGCDGQTYDSACEAEAAGASVDHDGACVVEQVDECEAVVCQNGSVCTDLPGDDTWECACAPGYTGDFCEIDIDECQSSPCTNGDCTDLINGWVCACAPGYTGTFCEFDIDECESQPCVNGECANLIDGWECACAPGYTGTFCEIDIDECQSSPCVNGANCNDLVNGWECECAPGFTGTTCEEVAGPCAVNPCQNDGACTETPSGGFSCVCATGWNGEDCSEAYDACAGELDDLGSTVPQSVFGSLEGLNDDLDSACSSMGGPDRAFTFTAPAAGGYRFDTIGSGFDAVLSVMNSCGGPELSCDDDSSGSLQSRIDIVLEEGETVYLLFDSYSPPNPGATYQLNVSTVAIDESVCPCLDEARFSGLFAAVVGSILASADACSEDGTSISGINGIFGAPDTFQVVEFFGRSFCETELLTYGLGAPRILATPTQAQACIDLIAQVASDNSLVCD